MPPLLITFSGLDGAGKSTQIQNLQALLASRGQSVACLAFWDDVVAGKTWREGFVHQVFKSEPGIGSPERPVQRRDKNVRGLHLSMARVFLYAMDTLRLRRVIARQRRRGRRVVIFDRYIYDELANLPLANPIFRGLARLLLYLAPRPDLAFLLDAEPEAARARKPEYPVEFMRECREWYKQLAMLIPNMVVVPPLPLLEVESTVRNSLCAVIAA